MSTKKHEMTKEELRAPDKFQAALESIWQKLVKHRKLILIGIVAFVGVGIGLWALSLSKKGATAAAANAQKDAIVAIGAEVGEKDPEQKPVPGVPEPLRFPDEAERLQALSESLGGFLGAHAGDDSAEAYVLTDANVKLARGQVAEAETAITGWLQQHADSPARPVALEIKARIHTQKGERDQAIAALDELAKAASGGLKAEALARIGDLQNPVMNAGQGDPGKAKSAYEAAIAELKTAMGAVTPDDSPGGVLGTLKNRLELLP